MQQIALKEKREVAQDTLLYTFERPEDFTFCAGQYVTLKVIKTSYKDEKGDFRAFSIASAPYQKNVLEFIMRRSESAFKKNLESLEPGETVSVTPAVGKCILSSPNEKNVFVFLVGGVGITPARSMILEAAYEKRPGRFYLFNSNRIPESSPFLEDFAAIEEGGNIRLTVVNTMTDIDKSKVSWSGEEGYIDAEKVKKYVEEDLGECTFYLVGTSGFIKAMKGMLESEGVKEEQVHVDNFG